MIFQDYEETKVIYHIISITDLKNTLEQGICYNDKTTYKAKYYGFHRFIEESKPQKIPSWVIRSKAIFGSMNYPKDHKFHSHSALLSLKIKPQKCWIANENLANQIYEPYILQEIDEFSACRNYLHTKGKELIRNYWETSLSFEENLVKRMDKQKGYDEEVLIFHSIPPEDIEILYIISDHRRMALEDWKKHFCI